MIQPKRAYDRASRDDGVRYLVERLWPRGIKKTELQLDSMTYTAIERRQCAVGLTVYTTACLEHDIAFEGEDGDESRPRPGRRLQPIMQRPP
jgi:uncharacterized protein DUF488